MEVCFELKQGLLKKAIYNKGHNFSKAVIKCRWHTLNSKRNYTLCFRASTQNVGDVGPQTGVRKKAH